MGRRIGALGLVNYKNHPADNRYKIFAFYKDHEAELFAKTLDEFNLKYEKDTDTVKNETIYLFAIGQKDFHKAQRANFRVSAKFRKPIIKNSFLRYALLLFVLGAIIIATVGYVKNMNILEKKTEELEQNQVN